MDYEKAFDSVQTQAILTSLQEQRIEDVYIEFLKDIYTDSSVTVHLHKESEKIRIKRGVRQGDTILPKLFTATLESIFRRLNWENKDFADIFLCTETPQELQQMLQELSHESRRMGLKMNIAKTKVMVADKNHGRLGGIRQYAKHRDILKSNLAICLKRQVYNSCLLPAIDNDIMVQRLGH